VCLIWVGVKLFRTVVLRELILKTPFYNKTCRPLLAGKHKLIKRHLRFKRWLRCKGRVNHINIDVITEKKKYRCNYMQVIIIKVQCKNMYVLIDLNVRTS